MADARDGRWAQAERGFRRAITLNPNQSRSRLDFGMWFLDEVGRTDEGIEQLRRAQTSGSVRARRGAADCVAAA